MAGLILGFLIADPGGVFIIIVIVVVIFLILSTVYSKRNRMLRKLKEYQPKSISLVKENEYARIKGKALAIQNPLISPIGKRNCVYYKIEVEEKRSNGKTSSWHTILTEEKKQDFILEDNKSKAIVTANIEGKSKFTYLIQDVEYSSGTWNDPPKFLENYLKTHDRKSTGFLGFNKSIRYKEGAIEIGEDITVLAIANWKESDHNFDRYSSKTLFLSGNTENKLIITDDPKAIKSGDL